MVLARFFPAKIQLAKRLVGNYCRRAFFFSLMFRTITQPQQMTKRDLKYPRGSNFFYYHKPMKALPYKFCATGILHDGENKP
ncbi:hypothetical protein AYI87_14325 [Shewanella sp. KCT]|nr:hypothetical protein AYI87_14325 [Shewanella sp. KCT]